jgi:hypothetical protein
MVNGVEHCQEQSRCGAGRLLILPEQRAISDILTASSGGSAAAEECSPVSAASPMLCSI